MARYKKEKAQVVELVNKVRNKHKHMGCKKVFDKIRPKMHKLGIRCSRDKFFDMMREEGMLVRYRKRYVKTTDSKHMFYKHPNLIKGLEITRSEQVFVSDITYINTQQGFMYLYLITDAYSKQIMGWDLADNLKTINAIKALKMALKNRKYPERDLLHHSDRGFQYCNPRYTEILEKHGIRISMTTKYDPYENAVAERVNGILKTEYEIGDGFLGYKDAKYEIKHAIWLYNTDRPHLSCNNLVPRKAHELENYELKTWSRNFSSKGYPLEENKTLYLNNN
jgi:transposase InsO family protein